MLLFDDLKEFETGEILQDVNGMTKFKDDLVSAFKKTKRRKVYIRVCTQSETDGGNCVVPNYVPSDWLALTINSGVDGVTNKLFDSIGFPTVRTTNNTSYTNLNGDIIWLDINQGFEPRFMNGFIILTQVNNDDPTYIETSDGVELIEQPYLLWPNLNNVIIYSEYTMTHAQYLYNSIVISPAIDTWYLWGSNEPFWKGFGKIYAKHWAYEATSCRMYSFSQGLSGRVEHLYPTSTSHSIYPDEITTIAYAYSGERPCKKIGYWAEPTKVYVDNIHCSHSGNASHGDHNYYAIHYNCTLTMEDACGRGYKTLADLC